MYNNVLLLRHDYELRRAISLKYSDYVLEMMQSNIIYMLVTFTVIYTR